MGKAMYLLEKDQSTSLIPKTKYKSEAELQEIIEKNPGLLLREQDAAAGNALFLVKRELPLPGPEASDSRLSLDHFLVDRFAVPVLVEVKQSANPESRRKVVGQMMDYAARISAYDSTDLQMMFEESNDGQEAPTDDPTGFWHNVSFNLKSGRMRLVFAADSLPNTLKVIIELLDRSMPDMDVYGVEIAKYKSEHGIFLTTSFIQNTAKSIIENSLGKPARWNDASIKPVIEKACGAWAPRVYDDFSSYLKELGYAIRFGNGVIYASFKACYGGQVLFGHDGDSQQYSLNFNTAKIAEATDGVFSKEDILHALRAFSNAEKYGVVVSNIYVKMSFSCLEEASNLAALKNLVKEILDACKLH
ncbi:MAG: hypothetical protein J6A79_16865 [Clostridia bacterium]|nr:hypothetical protein [Oscillospiraceae bacterium]MBO5570583.1 hypothetical protein [Clostridia bacterium]